MFDGYMPSAPGRFPPPKQPHLIDTRAMLPMLRVHASAVAVEYLAYAAAFNTIEAARWAATASGGGGLNSPSLEVAEALDALAVACGRHQSLTGCDGLALASFLITRDFGSDLAGHVLAPLVGTQATSEASTPSHNVPLCPPTAAERTTAIAAVLDLGFSDDRLGELGAFMEALRLADAADVGEPGEVTLAALERVSGALQEAARQGVTQEYLQWVLNVWANATSAPRVMVHDIPEN